MSFIVTPGELNRRAELYHQLGSVIAAGVPLPQALEMVNARPSIRASRKTVAKLIHCLESGLPFSESLAQVQGWIPDFDIALLTAGEQSGRLDGSFKLLSSYYTFRAKIIRDTLADLVVTIATLHVFLLVFPLRLLVAFVHGIMMGQYSDCVPFLIQKLVVFGGLYGAVLLLIYACQGRHGEPWRAFMEFITQRIPLLRTAQKYLVVSRLAGALEALNSAGVSIVSAWELAGAACGSPHLRHEILKWRPQVKAGTTPAELVNQTRYFPEMFANLYSTGEQSGQLDDAFRRLQVYYQDEGFRKLRMFTRIMNGTIYGLVVVLVAINVIRFYLNYYGAILGGGL